MACLVEVPISKGSGALPETVWLTQYILNKHEEEGIAKAEQSQEKVGLALWS